MRKTLLSKMAPFHSDVQTSRMAEKRGRRSLADLSSLTNHMENLVKSRHSPRWQPSDQLAYREQSQYPSESSDEEEDKNKENEDMRFLSDESQTDGLMNTSIILRHHILRSNEQNIRSQPEDQFYIGLLEATCLLLFTSFLLMVVYVYIHI